MYRLSFGFGELKLLEGSDQNYFIYRKRRKSTFNVSQRIINNFRDIERDKIMDKVIKDTDKEVYRMYDDVVQEEKRWATYLFQKVL